MHGTEDKSPYWAECNFLFNDSKGILGSRGTHFEHQVLLYAKHESNYQESFPINQELLCF